MTNLAGVCGSERKEEEEGQGRGKASTANPTLRWLLSQVSCGGWGSGRGCGCHYTVLVFRLLFLQRLRTLLSACELFSVSISVLVFYNDDVSNPFVLFLFFLVFPPPLALLPSLPLPFHPSLPLPPLPRYRMCVCHVFHQSYGTECNQSHAPVSDYGGMVLLPFLQLSVSLVPLIHALHSVIVLAIICLSHL